MWSHAKQEELWAGPGLQLSGFSRREVSGVTLVLPQSESTGISIHLPVPTQGLLIILLFMKLEVTYPSGRPPGAEATWPLENGYKPQQGSPLTNTGHQWQPDPLPPLSGALQVTPGEEDTAPSPASAGPAPNGQGASLGSFVSRDL